MAIEVISWFKQKNNGKFPLIDSNDIKGGFYIVDTVQDMINIPTERRTEGMLAYVKNDSMHWYQLSNNQWIYLQLTVDYNGKGFFTVPTLDKLASVGQTNGTLVYVESNSTIYLYDNGWKAVSYPDNIPVYTQAKIDANKDILPSTYLAVPSVTDLNGSTTNNTYKVTKNGNYVDILFSAVRQLQAEIAKIKNAFTYGIESYTDTNTGLGAIAGDYTDVEAQEPLWAIEEGSNDMSLLYQVDMNNPTDTIIPSKDTVVTNEREITKIGIQGTATWTGKANGEEVNETGIADCKDYKILTYITSTSKNIQFTFKSSTNGQTYSIDLNNLLEHDEDSLYYISIIVSRQFTDPTINKPIGENYIWVSIVGKTENKVLVQGYIVPTKDGYNLSQYQYKLPNPYYPSSITFTDTTLTKFNIYSRYEDFSNDVIPNPPVESGLKYKTSHITIRSVATEDILDKIIKDLQPNELVWVTGSKSLYIVSSKHKKQAIGSSNSDKTDIDTMTVQELLTNLQEAGLITLSNAKYDTDGKLTSVDDISVNDVADITFINQGTGKKFNFKVDTEGNLKGSEIPTESALLSTKLKNIKLNIKDDYNFRGFIGHVLGQESGKDFTKDLGLDADRLKIGSFYAPTEEDISTGNVQCTHAFIELENTSDKDICLQGCYLNVTKPIRATNKSSNSPTVLQANFNLPLTGTIPAGGTYLIRGRRYIDHGYINVSTYDQEFYVNNFNTLITTDFEGRKNAPIDDTYIWDNNSLLDLSINVDPVNNKYYYGISLTYNTPATFIDTLAIENHGGNATDWKSGTSTYHYMVKEYFIDSIAYAGSTQTVWESSNISKPTVNTVAFPKASNSIYKNMFELDPAKQAFQSLHYKDSSRLRWQSADDLQVLNLDDEYLRLPLSDDIYPVSKFTPKASFEHKNVCTDKSKLDTTKPNMVTVGFGINMYTTRTFNWVSVGDRDEYVWVREKGTTTWSGPFESYTTITDKNTESSTYPRRVEFDVDINNAAYARISGKFPADGSPYTAHKCILNIVENAVNTPKVYEYIVGTKGSNNNPSPNYISDVQTFTLYPTSYTPTIYQITDQQGFHWYEYQAWAESAEIVNNKIKEDQAKSNIMPILINTGDMTQNGTRINEWLDYYNAGKHLFDHLEQMNVVGNNDLGNPDINSLGTGDDPGKSNPYFYNLFYCYEIDPANAPLYKGRDGVVRYIPSTFYTKSSSYLFLFINSELTHITCADIYKAPTEYSNNVIQNTVDLYTGYKVTINGTTEYNTDSGAEYVPRTDGYKYIYELLYNILKTNSYLKGSSLKVIAACHEMPFTVVTNANLQASKRGNDRSDNNGKLVGSHTNRLYTSATFTRSKGTYWLSRLLEYFKVKYCIGGHKHTYAISNPLREYYYYSNKTKNSLTDGPMVMPESLKDDDCYFYSSDGLSNLTKFPITPSTNYSEVSDTSYITCLTSDTYSGDKTYVTYVMCQATGFKLKSNKELPSEHQVFSKVIPHTTSKTTGDSPDNNQLSPMFIRAICNWDSTQFQLIKILNITNKLKSGVPTASKFNQQNNDYGTPKLQYMNDLGKQYYGTWTDTETTLSI